MVTKLADEWLTIVARACNTYLDDTVPRGAGIKQLQEARRAFYAGAYAFLDGIVLPLVRMGEVNDAGLQLLMDVQQQLKAFSTSYGLDQDTSIPR